MRHMDVFLVLVGGSMLCLAGCGHASCSQALCEAFIPEGLLPEGWKLLPSSEMPPSDKMPWWTENPLLLEGPGAKQLDVEGKPTSASRVRAAMYVNDDGEMIIFCLTYNTREAALAEYQALRSGHAQGTGMIGLSRHDDNTIVFLGLSPECPNREVFVRHFESIAEPR